MMGWMDEAGKYFGSGLNLQTFSGAGPHTISASAGMVTISHSASVLVNLPAVATAKKVLVIGNVGSASISLDGNSSEQVNGATTYGVGANTGCILYNTGTSWIASSGGGGGTVTTTTSEESAGGKIYLALHYGGL